MTRELRRDVLLPLVILVSIAVLASAGSTALLGRMAPAIERILAENLYSIEAIEEMLAAIARPGADDEAQQRFAEALDRASGNVTEESERAELATIEQDWPAAFAGDPEARSRAIGALLALGAINRAAVVRRDEEARRLGYAGAWAAVFLGALSFAWALIAVRRARRRLIDPLLEIRAGLEAAHAGDSFRRCRRIPAPSEVVEIMKGTDELLDARALRGFAEQPSLRSVVDRQILLHLLEQQPGPAWVVTAEGSIDAANGAGLERLSGDGAAELRDRLAGVAAGEVEGLAVERVAEVDRYLVTARRHES